MERFNPIIISGGPKGYKGAEMAGKGAKGS